MMYRILILSFLGALVAVMSQSVSKNGQTFPPQGEPGIDFPAYADVPPRLAFTCQERIPGYYADPETQCQVWHWCVPGGRKYSFLCPNGTVFNQQYRVCDWWYNVECSMSPNLYNINEDLYKDAKGNAI